MEILTQAQDSPLIVILGPTASGKTQLAVEVAAQLGGEIISADSRQVYRGMDIGTGKDYEEYLRYFEKEASTSASAPKIKGLHLVDVVEAGKDYHVARFQKDFQEAYQSIIARHKMPILCGGSGMYIEAVLRNYEYTQIPINQILRDELEQQSIDDLLKLFQTKYQEFYPDADTSTRKRLIRAIEVANFKNQEPTIQVNNLAPRFRATIFGITIPSEVRRERITKRLHSRLANGMIEEVQGLLRKGIPADKLIFYGLEYKFITEYLIGKLAYDEMVKRLEIAIHQFAKRQMTFFRSMERKGIVIHWLDGLESMEKLAQHIVSMIQK